MGKVIQMIPQTDSASDKVSLKTYEELVGKEPLLSNSEERELCKRIQEGDQEALETLVKSSLRFVIPIAKRYAGQGLSLPDLINEGNLGLISAAQKFNSNLKYFMPFAVLRITKSIKEAIKNQ